jgi:hypothetical protein
MDSDSEQIFQTNETDLKDGITATYEGEIDIANLKFTKTVANEDSEAEAERERSDSLLKPIFNQAKRINFKKEMESIRKADKQTRKARREHSLSNRAGPNKGSRVSLAKSKKSKRLNKTSISMNSNQFKTKKFSNSRKNKLETNTSIASGRSQTSRSSMSKPRKYKFKGA